MTFLSRQGRDTNTHHIVSRDCIRFDRPIRAFTGFSDISRALSCDISNSNKSVSAEER